MLKKTKAVLDLLAKDTFFKDNDVRFVGGTALSFLINHRLSEDLDFAMLELPKEKIKSMMLRYGGVKRKHSDLIIDYALNDGEDIEDYHIMFDLNGVKIDFFVPPFNNKEKSIWENNPCTIYEDSNIKIASFETIFYMKTMAFWNRKKYRDVYDIYFVLSNNIDGYTAKKFIEEYIGFNITFTKEDMQRKIQSTTEFYEKQNDEGINTLVSKPKSYEWYRSKLEEMITNVYLAELYE
jgi:predicted nucleotidyltransferase component of viral defense system